MKNKKNRKTKSSRSASRVSARTAVRPKKAKLKLMSKKKLKPSLKKPPKLSKKMSKILKDKLRKQAEQDRLALEAKAKKEACLRELDRIKKVLSHSFARQAIVNLAGENSLEIIKSFETNLSDEEIAKRLKLKISDVRATLNKLHGEGLVSYYRDKNNETGWYSYSWIANGERIEGWVNNHLEQRKLAPSTEIDHYFCPACGVNSIHDFESASNVSFKCHLCNKNLEFLDAQKRNDLVFGKNERV